MNNIQLPVQIIARRIKFNKLDVLYPFIIGGTDLTAINRMNQQIFNLVNKIIIEQGFYQSPLDTEVIGYFEIKTNQRGILSLSISNYTYHYHAAHGLTIIKSLTFNIKTGKSYQLYELFKPNSEYIKILSNIVETQIKEREIPIIEAFTGVKPDQDYYIADKALVIYYQLYDITPYVYGFPMFPISVYEIEDIIMDNTPLSVMLING